MTGAVRTSGYYWLRTVNGWEVAHFTSVNGGDGYWRMCGSFEFVDDLDLSARRILVGPRIGEPTG